MKANIIYVTFFVAAVAFVFSVVFGLRWISSAATPVQIISPKPGVTCATMVTSDGAAISCWKD